MVDMLACVCVGLPRDMIVLACVEIHHIRSWVLGLLAGGERLAGDVCWAHPKEHLWRVPGFRRGIPVMGAFRVPLWRIRMRTEILAAAYEELVGVNIISGTL